MELQQQVIRTTRSRRCEAPGIQQFHKHGLPAHPLLHRCRCGHRQLISRGVQLRGLQTGGGVGELQLVWLLALTLQLGVMNAQPVIASRQSKRNLSFVIAGLRQPGMIQRTPGTTDQPLRCQVLQAEVQIEVAWVIQA